MRTHRNSQYKSATKPHNHKNETRTTVKKTAACFLSKKITRARVFLRKTIITGSDAIADIVSRIGNIVSIYFPGQLNRRTLLKAFDFLLFVRRDACLSLVHDRFLTNLPWNRHIYQPEASIGTSVFLCSTMAATE